MLAQAMQQARKVAVLVWAQKCFAALQQRQQQQARMIAAAAAADAAADAAAEASSAQQQQEAQGHSSAFGTFRMQLSHKVAAASSRAVGLWARRVTAAGAAKEK